MEGYFYAQNERDFNIYKEEHQDVPEQGRCLTFCIFKIMSLPFQEGFLIFNNSKHKFNESRCCGCYRFGRY
jgi:hypothetical protein